MATLKSKKLQEALKKAKNVGRHEEPVTIDGCSLVLQSLPSSAYDAVIQEISDLEGAEYAHAYQIGHVCRSIVEIEGVDLREVQFVEDDVPSGTYLVNAVVPNEAKAKKAREVLLKELGLELTVVPPDGSEERTVMVERHEWLRERVASWSQEAVSIAYRKFTDVVVMAGEKAKEGIQFRVADESAEDKFRRLLAEAKEVEGELAPDLAKKVLEDAGYLQKTSEEELAEIKRRALEFQQEQQRLKEEVTKEEAPTPAPQESSPEDVAALMRNRPRLNQQAMNVPVPVQTAERAPQAQPARVPPQIANAVNLSAKAREIAALEGDVDPTILEHMQQPQSLPKPQEVAELSRPTPGVDRAGFGSIYDTKPVGGINPKFHRRQT